MGSQKMDSLHWTSLVTLERNINVFKDVLAKSGCKESDRTVLSSYWKYLFALFETPRPSTNYRLPEDPKRLDRVRELLQKLAKDVGAEYKTDGVGNVILTKKGTGSCGDPLDSDGRPVLCLQGHLDMVCNRNSDSKHDFDTDGIPVKLVLEEGKNWIKSAVSSTLGADNGVAIAASLALMESLPAEKLPKTGIELLATVNEETDFSGAEKLGKPDIDNFLRSKRLLNLDSEDADAICLGCAGGFEYAYYVGGMEFQKSTSSTASQTGTTSSLLTEKQAADNYHLMRIDVKGFHGGHSGGDVHRDFANANQIIVQLLRVASNTVGSSEDSLGGKRSDGNAALCLVELKGGTGPSAISREAGAIVAIPKNQDLAKIRNSLEQYFEKTVKERYKASEDVSKIELIFTIEGIGSVTVEESPELTAFLDLAKTAKMKVTPSETRMVRWLTHASMKSLLTFLEGLPHGVLRFAEDHKTGKRLKDLHGDDLVESSINFGIALFNGKVTRQNAGEVFSKITNQGGNISGPKRYCWRCQQFEALGGTYNHGENDNTIIGARNETTEVEPVDIDDPAWICPEVDNGEKNEDENEGPESGTCYVYLFYRSSNNDTLGSYNSELHKLLNKDPALKIDNDPNLYPFPAWQPKWDSPFLGKIVEAYKGMKTKQESKETTDSQTPPETAPPQEKSRTDESMPPRLYTCHGGLECGCLMETYPDLDCVSIGPEIKHPHSPDEKVSVEGCCEWLEWVQAVVEGFTNQV